MNWQKVDRDKYSSLVMRRVKTSVVISTLVDRDLKIQKISDILVQSSLSC